MKQWSLEDLDLSKAIDVIPSQDPQTALRFNVPVPNWLDAAGAPRFAHDQIRLDDKGVWRFNFFNDKDNCWQDVRIDGSSVITYMGPSPEQAEKLTACLRALSPDPEAMTPDKMEQALTFAKEEIGLRDVYNNGRKSIAKYMHAWPAPDEAHPASGAFLPNPQLSAAVYIPGAGEFLDGPTATPQKFENGAFISFPGQPAESVRGMTMEELRSGKSFTVKLVQADVFLSSRTLPDGAGISTPRDTGPKRKSSPSP